MPSGHLAGLNLPPGRGGGGAALSGSLLLLCLRFPLAPSSQLCLKPLSGICASGTLWYFPCLSGYSLNVNCSSFIFFKSFYLLTISYTHITNFLLPLNDISAQMLLSQKGLPCLPPWYYNIMLIMICSMH